MKFPPKISDSTTIKRLLYELDVLKAGYELNPASSGQAINLRRKSILKSSLFSARIEGNPLELSDMDELDMDSTEVKKIEVTNLVKAYEKMSEYVREHVSVELIKSLHRTVLYRIDVDAGSLRTEESAIYNQAGIAVYVAPAPQTVRPLLDALCRYINETKDMPPVAAGVAHIWFEKIHPFADGNGRVGRLLSSYILKKHGYDFSGLVPFEEYLDTHRDDYYRNLGKDTQDVTEFVEFYVDALIAQAKVSLTLVHLPQVSDPYAQLLPRRAEIMRIITDHKILSFDFLARRFRAVPERSLHYDLAQLVKAGLVVKMGMTRGVCYSVKNVTKPSFSD